MPTLSSPFVRKNIVIQSHTKVSHYGYVIAFFRYCEVCLLVHYQLLTQAVKVDLKSSVSQVCYFFLFTVFLIH